MGNKNTEKKKRQKARRRAREKEDAFANSLRRMLDKKLGPIAPLDDDDMPLWYDDGSLDDAGDH